MRQLFGTSAARRHLRRSGRSGWAGLLAGVFSLASLAEGCGGSRPGRDTERPGPPTSALPQPVLRSAPADPSTRSTTDLGAPNGDDTAGTKLAEVAAQASTPSTGSKERNSGRTPQDIRAIVLAHREEARACYDRGLSAHPGLDGDLVIRWTIDPAGVVTQTSLDESRSQITEPTVVKCISEILKGIRFATSPGGFETQASYPFNFRPRPPRRAPSQPSGAGSPP